MDFSKYIYFNFFTIGALIPAIFMGVLSYFFIAMKNKTKSTMYLTLFLSLSTLFFLSYAVAASIYHPLAAYHRWVTIGTCAIAQIFIGLAIFHFPDDRNPVFGRIYKSICYIICMSLAVYFFYVSYHSNKIFQFAGHYWDFNAEKASKINALGILAAIATILVMGIWRTIVNRGLERWAALGIGGSIWIMFMIPGILNILSRDGLLDRGTYQISQNLSTITGVFVAVIIYMNVTRQRSNFMSKILIVTVAVLLLLVQGFSYYSLRDQEQSFDLILRSETALALAKEKNPENMEYMVSYSFKDGKVSTKYTKDNKPLALDFSDNIPEFHNTLIYDIIEHLDKNNFKKGLNAVLNGSDKCFEGYKKAISKFADTIDADDKNPIEKIIGYIDSIERPVLLTRTRISQIPEDNFAEDLKRFLPDARTKIFNEVILDHIDTAGTDSKNLRKEILSFLAPMRKPGARIYRKDAADKNHYVAVMEADTVNNTVVEAGYPYLDYRVYVHDTSKKYMILLFIMLGVIIFGFPFFFWGSLVKPIRNLLSGLKEMQKGNLKIRIPVRVEDEFGFMSRNFNIMAENIERNEKELIAIRSFLSNMIESMPSMLISLDGDGIVTQWNHAAEVTTGIKAMDILGKNIWAETTIFNEYQEVCREIINKREAVHLYRQKFEGPPLKYENVSLYPLVENGISGMVIRMDDVTELEKKDEQLRQAQKMETVGTLAGGLAHDFNNVLGGIVGTVSLIKYDISEKQSIDINVLKDYIETIDRAGQRAADMVKQLLSLSGRREYSFAPVDLNHTIKSVFSLCSNTIDKSVELKPFYTNEPAMINADPGQMEQVLLNLCINASHAMTIMREAGEHQGGTLAISLKKILPDKFFRSTHPEAKEISYWVLSVQDTGTGMDSKTVAKIFDPFFTTKEKEKGTGLGLAMVYNIVQEHGGFIDVYSEIGIGTAFNIYLPSIEDFNEEEVSGKNIKIAKGTGVVLIVDDENLMRGLAVKILTECGYSVLLAENGEDGVKMFKKHHSEIAVVLLDLVMPKKSGKESFIEMKKIDPDVKVLLASGFKWDERVEDVLSLGVKGFIQKPYTIEKLSEAISLVINK